MSRVDDTRTFRPSDLGPLDLVETLAQLGEWEGREVSVIAHGDGPKFVSATEISVHGALGGVEMVDNAIDQDVDSVARFQVGAGYGNCFFISPKGFRHTLRLPGREYIKLLFEHGFRIEVQPLDGG